MRGPLTRGHLEIPMIALRATEAWAKHPDKARDLQCAVFAQSQHPEIMRTKITAPTPTTEPPV